MHIFRHHKFFILTFFAYIWSGSDAISLSSIFQWPLLILESIFMSILQKVVDFVLKIRFVREIFGAAVEEMCIFQCPSGVAPKLNSSHIPQSNGCGSQGVMINSKYLPLSEMTKCCDVHDICYDTCNSDKDNCDLDFKSCLYKHCVNYKTSGEKIVNKCKAAAKILFTGTAFLGCKSYIDAQENACFCEVPESETQILRLILRKR